MITDDQLTLYYYDDGLTPQERGDIKAALLADPELTSRYAVIRGGLEALSRPADEKAPEHALQRWHDSIDRVARIEQAKTPAPKSGFHLMSFVWGGAVAAALGVVVGIYFFGKQSANVPVIEQVPVASDQSSSTVPVSFTRGLQVHLRDSRAELALLPEQADEIRHLLLSQIIQQNRVFERAADTNNAPDVARLLRAFEPILMRLASEDTAPEDAEALRAQLSFELNAMLTKLENRSSEDDRTI